MSSAAKIGCSHRQSVGPKASAILYSLVETAKANGINVYDYIIFLFEELVKKNYRPRAVNALEFHQALDGLPQMFTYKPLKMKHRLLQSKDNRHLKKPSV